LKVLIFLATVTNSMCTRNLAIANRSCVSSAHKIFSKFCHREGIWLLPGHGERRQHKFHGV